MAARIRTSLRVLLGACGAGSWAAGGVATFVDANGPGAVALIGAGAASGALALIGRWPQKVSVSGHEVSWPDVEEAVVSSMTAAEANGEAAADELRTLWNRLKELERTGAIPPHPAEVYDREVAAAIARTLPGARVTPSGSRLNSVPDFEVSYGDRDLLVETKWRRSPAADWHADTLDRLVGNLPAGRPLLVVTNARDVTRARQRLDATMGERARVVSWEGPGDDPGLGQAFRALMPA